MEVQFRLNGKHVTVEAGGDTILLEVLRNLGCRSVKCGCETTNCGLCTVWIDGKSRLSCSVLAASVEGCEITTLEGVEKEAAAFGAFLADEGAEQCGFCSPGFIMNVLAMFRELKIHLLTKSKNTFPAICADVPDIWGSSAQYRNICKVVRQQKCWRTRKAAWR